MASFLIGAWLILFGVIPTEIPKWIVPIAAVVAGLFVLYGGWSSRKTP